MFGKTGRRGFILGAGVAAAALWLPVSARSGPHEKSKEFPYAMSDEEWKDKLSPEQYRVLRQEGTERAFTSPLNDEKRDGIFMCAGCEQELFSSSAKYDSGTGWPSFFQPVKAGAVATSTDHKLGYPRTEVHCSRCGGHLGHVFEDGPKPTGLRYCMNGVALTFRASD